MGELGAETAIVEYDRPLPQADAETAAFWDAARRHELVVQRCEACEKLRFPPSPNCIRCSSERFTWHRVSGTGTIFSFVVVHHATMPQFKPYVPYNVIQVSLSEDPTVLIEGNAVDVANGELRIGQRVRVVFDDVTLEDTIPRWELEE
jgi:uncharacterized OB-fold protein